MNNAFPHVFLQSAGHTEGHLTEPALVDILPHPPVGLHMSEQNIFSLVLEFIP